MAKIHFLGGEFQGLDDNGDPLNGGKVYFYEPGTTTLKNVYTDATLSVAATNPVILDANGRAAIWLNGEYKVKLTDSADVQIYEEDNINTGTSGSTSGGLQQPLNGSFEDDTDLDNAPDNWTLSALTDGTIAIDSTDQAHGYNSLKFTSGGNGGGTATSTRFDVLAGKEVRVRFTYKSSSETSENKVDLKTYDKDDAIVTTHPIYNESTSIPSTYTTFDERVTVGATAVRAEIVITGVGAGGTVTAAVTSNFDNIEAEILRDNSLIFFGTDQPTTSGTAVDFTSIPSWTKKITINYENVSHNGTSIHSLLLGDSEGFEATGYAGYLSGLAQASQTLNASTTSFYIMAGATGTGHFFHGSVTLTLLDAANNTWCLSGAVGGSNGTANFVWTPTGVKSLSDTLTQISITSTSLDTFDGGSVNIVCEG